MKLKLKVTHVDPAKGELSFTPLGSELRGLLSYTGLPQRAIGRCHAGQTVEAEIPLPDFYPVAGDAHNASEHDEYKRHFGEYPIENNVGRIAGFLGNTHALAKLESYDRAFADQIRNAHRDLLVIARELARAKKYAEMIA